jgi:DNA-binding MarR family transcriptional regulator
MADWIDELAATWAEEHPDMDTWILSPVTRLVRLGVLMDHMQRDTFEPFDLAFNDYNVLANLQRSGPPYELSPSELCTALELSSGGMTGILKRLESLDLVKRSPAPDDGRSTLVTLTDAGLELEHEIFQVFLTRTHALLQSVSRKQLKEVDNSLRVLLNATESYFYR